MHELRDADEARNSDMTRVNTTAGGAASAKEVCDALTGISGCAKEACNALTGISECA